MSIPYRGMHLDPKVFELKNGSGWTAEVDVWEDVEEETVVSLYVLRGAKFQTKEAATEASVGAGRKVVDDRLKNKEIGSVIEHETRLPATHRTVYGNHSDDVATGTDGRSVKVPSPENPEDRFR